MLKHEDPGEEGGTEIYWRAMGPELHQEKEKEGIGMFNSSPVYGSARWLKLTTAALGLALLLHSGAAYAQRTTASIAGSVTDESQAAVPGAKIVVRNLDTGAESTVESNDLGYYVAPALPAGPCSITVSRTGFQTQTVPQVILRVDQ